MKKKTTSKILSYRLPVYIFSTSSILALVCKKIKRTGLAILQRLNGTVINVNSIPHSFLINSMSLMIFVANTVA